MRSLKEGGKIKVGLNLLIKDNDGLTESCCNQVNQDEDEVVYLKLSAGVLRGGTPHSAPQAHQLEAPG